MTEPNKIGVELWDIERLVPYEQNAKKHPADQIKKLATAIKAYGWTQPIVVDADGVIIAGHGRRLAALELGLKKVPVVCRKDLSKAEADALRLADNRVASTEYDTSLLQEELARLASEDIDLSSMGFDEKELTFLTADLGEFNDDVFIDDIGAAVEEQKAQNTQKAAEVDSSAAPVADALGFKRVTVAQSREIRELMGRAETRTGQKGADALLAVLRAGV